MRILRVAQHLYPDTKGGGQYHVHAMSRDQAAMGHDVTVLTTQVDDSLPKIEETDGYTVVRVSPGVTLLGNDVSPAIARYLWGVNSKQFDVIHAHSHLYFSTNLAALKRELGDIPLAITNHGLYTQSAPKWVFDIYLRTIGRWTFNQADVVFCYTDADKQRVRDLGVTSPIEVVPNGIDTDRFTPDGPKSDLINASGPVILFVGRLVDGKRPEIAIETLSQIHESDPTVELYLCGEGPLRDVLEKRVDELDMLDSVTFMGQVSYDEMPKVYRQADVLILPSRAEGVPRTIMEALSSGVPVVSSDLPQVRSAFGDDVAYVDSGNSLAVTNAIREGLNGLGSTLESAFQWERTVRESTEELEAIVGV
ncbi:glycosyltransferase family 4 protein [Halorubraceae archaeon YAN]|nr:glycosyltransferase family 4 protein [Halorubraceae archaeon YAN]